MKKYLFLIMLSLIGSQVFKNSALAESDKIIAVINKEVITQQELNNRIRMIGSNIPTKTALDILIDEKLQLQVAKLNNLNISSKDIDLAISNIAKNNKITVEQLKKELPVHTGLTFDQYIAQIKNQMLLNQIQSPLLKDMTIEKKEILQEMKNSIVNNKLNKYHVLDVLIEIKNESSKKSIEESKNIAEKIAIQLRQEKELDCQQILKKYSNSKVKISCNDLGSLIIDELPSLYISTVSSMKKNQVCEPILAPNGFHLLKLLDVINIEQKITKEQAYNVLYNKKAQKIIKPWLKELRDTSYVKILIN